MSDKSLIFQARCAAGGRIDSNDGGAKSVAIVKCGGTGLEVWTYEPFFEPGKLYEVSFVEVSEYRVAPEQLDEIRKSVAECKESIGALLCGLKHVRDTLTPPRQEVAAATE